MVPAEQAQAKFFGPATQSGDRNGDKQAAGQQHQGVAATEPDVKLLAGGNEFLGITRQVDRIKDKQPAEQQHLGKEEEPHAELGAGIVLVYMPAHRMPAFLKS